MDSAEKKPAGLAASLALGLSVPLLFALYSVYLGKTRPEQPELRHLGGAQVAFFAALGASLVGFVPACLQWKLIRDYLKKDLKSIALLIVFTLLGPPLYFVSVALLGPSPANWIDLGMTPVITFVLAVFVHKEYKSHKGLTISSAVLALIGIGLVMAAMPKQTLAGKEGVAGVVIALVSAFGTSGAGSCLNTVQQGQNKVGLSPLTLLFIRYAIPTVVLAGILAFFGSQAGTYKLALNDTMSTAVIAIAALFVLPNVIYIQVTARKSLMFTGYMWALLPVFGSVAEFLLVDEGKTSLPMLPAMVAGVLVLAATVLEDMAKKRAPSPPEKNAAE